MNRQTKSNLYSALNATMRNNNISAKTKFSILPKLMKNNNISRTPPLVEDNNTGNDPQQQK